jgi:hypothetical protein
VFGRLTVNESTEDIIRLRFSRGLQLHYPR